MALSASGAAVIGLFCLIKLTECNTPQEAMLYGLTL